MMFMSEVQSFQAADRLLQWDVKEHDIAANNIYIYVYSPKRQNSNNIVNIRIDDIKYEIKQ